MVYMLTNKKFIAEFAIIQTIINFVSQSSFKMKIRPSFNELLEQNKFFSMHTLKFKALLLTIKFINHGRFTRNKTLD